MLQKLKNSLRPITRHIPPLYRKRDTFRAAFPARPLPQVQWGQLIRKSAPPLENTPDLRVRFDGPSAADDILLAVRAHGIAVIDNFMPQEMIEEATRAARGNFDSTNSVLIPAQHDSKMILLSGFNLEEAKKTHRSFDFASNHPLLEQAGNDFFGDPDWTNTGLYGLVYLDQRKGDVHFHIDPSACLKALIYLTDVDDESDGAFVLDVNSHREGYYRMMTHYYEGLGKRSFEVPEAEVRSPAHVRGKAGTCILFNSIVIHRAGEIETGHKRLSLTYFFDRPYASDANINIPPFLYSHRHQSEERPYVQD